MDTVSRRPYPATYKSANNNVELNYMSGSRVKQWIGSLFRPARKRSVLALLVIGAFLCLAGVVGFNFSMHATSTDEFCIGCHEQRDNSLVMFEQTVHYSNASGVVAGCSDCHVPHEFGPKMIRKMQAAREVWGHLTGVIDTPEKYAAHAPHMKAKEIARLRANDSQECRNCHEFDQVIWDLQSVQARTYHQTMLDTGKTCIDCHAGLAHDPADMPGATPIVPEVLADSHAEHGLCYTCHVSGEGPEDDNFSHENAQCISCHGDLEAIATGEPAGEVSPHLSHFIGDVACTTCHKGHQQSVTYCAACHSFDFDLPFGGPWSPELAPLMADEADRVAQEKAISEPPREHTDVVVVGSGGAGLSAAVSARDAGARVILLEKEPVPGGNTKLAAGGMNAAGTRSQSALGIEDDKQLMIEDTIEGGHGINDPALVEVLAEDSSASIDWLTALGADMSDVGRMGGASVNRSHRPTGGAGVGAHVAQVLWDAAVERGTDIRFNSRVVRVLKGPNGAVSGVLVHGEVTGYYVIGADAVILATGGFSRNNKLVASFDPKLEGFDNTNQPGATGDGLEVAQLAGAATTDLEYIQAHPTYSPVGGVLVTEAVRGNGAILVNRGGRRFVNEITTRDKAAAAILAQEGGSVYLVFDDSVRKSLSKIESFIHLKIVEQGPSIEALAERIGMPPAALAQTVASYNGAVDAGSDSEFQRPDLPRKLTTGPYYAIEVTPAVHHTMGGIKIGSDTRVQSVDGAFIEGLYAAGEATGGVHGSNRLGGNAVSDIVTFGRLAGAEAASHSKGD
jgi:fumarate reductase flavoprotein subunit